MHNCCNKQLSRLDEGVEALRGTTHTGSLYLYEMRTSEENALENENAGKMKYLILLWRATVYRLTV